MTYGLYLATVVSVALKDNRLQVRIEPQMHGIPAESCPKWSFFFRDEILLAKENDLVWVICNDDFSTGYVLGLANYTTYNDESFEKYSVPEKLKQIVSNIFVDLKTSAFSFTDLKVTFWNNNSIHMIERSTGGIIIAYSNGSIYIARPDEFRIRIGSSELKFVEGNISLAALSVQIQGDDIGLGKDPVGNLLTSIGDRAGVAVASKYVRA